MTIIDQSFQPQRPQNSRPRLPTPFDRVVDVRLAKPMRLGPSILAARLQAFVAELLPNVIDR